MSLDLIKNTLKNGGAHLGDLIFWSLSDARIDRGALESIWAGAGLDAALLPDAPSSEKALKLAVREAAVGQSERLLRLAKEDAGYIVYAVVREQRPGDGTVAYQQEARIQLDRQREVFSSDDPSHDLVVAVKSRYEIYKTTHHSDDVRRAIVKTLHSLAAVTLRDGGGIYWVPSPFSAKVRQLQTAIEQIGASRVHLLPVSKSAEAEATLGEIAKGSIEHELADLRSEVQAFLHVPPERASTLERRLDAFDGLRSRARLYRSLLAVEVADLDSQLDGLASMVGKLLDQKSAA